MLILNIYSGLFLLGVYIFQRRQWIDVSRADKIVRVTSLALGQSVQGTIEGMKGVEFSGLDRLKGKDLLWYEPLMVHTLGLLRRHIR